MMSNPTLCRNGFTLIELMLVVMLMSSLALVATAFVDNAGQQMGFDQTKSRLEQVRRAIIGDTSRSINGQPELSGFVADMGRLPENLSELIEPQPLSLWNEVPIPGGELHGGWRGPYLDAMPESSGTRAFRDGWGNQTEDSVEDGKNYGWVFTKEVDDPATTDIDESARIFLQSLGADFAAGQVDTNNPYQKDYPVSGNVVSEHDWRVDVGNQEVKVQINGPVTITDSLEVKIYWLKNRSLQTIPFTADTVDASHALTVQFPADKYLPMGTYAILVMCAGTEVPYDGSCPSADPSILRAQYFKILPRAHQTLQFEWNTQ